MSEFDKVDRALELQVIDWLQWGEFPERLDKPSMPALALELIVKRKSANAELERRLSNANAERQHYLRVWDEKLTAERERADALEKELDSTTECLIAEQTMRDELRAKLKEVLPCFCKGIK